MGNAKNFQLLLGIGIIASLLALISAIFGFVNTTNPLNSHKLVSTATTPKDCQTFAQVPNVPEGLFYYGGTTTFASMRFTSLVSAINQAHPRFRLRYTEKIGSVSDSTNSMKMLLAGEISFIQSARPLNNSELKAAKEREIVLDQIPIAIDGVVFFVNPQVSISRLTLGQIKDIFKGKITNWKSLGGKDLPITPISRDPNVSDTASFIQEQVLTRTNFGKTVQIVDNTTAAIRKVATTPGGISYATASQVNGQKTVSPLALSREDGEAFISPFADTNRVVNHFAFTDGSYPLTRKLYVVVKRGGIDEQAGVAYANLLLTAEGQRAIVKAGFAPIR
ncbi:PstS family phosphate ABC transporter substrate-binding protein [Aliterella atlantica]|nr:substrate-binding domain-containing protein [Aliterella atlantica]